MRAWLTRSTHISWHIAWLAGGYVIGLGLVPSGIGVVSGLWWPVAAVGLLIVSFSRRTMSLTLLSLMAGVCLGAWRGSLEQTALLRYAPHFGKQVVIMGTITEDVDRDKSGDIKLRLGDISIEGQSLRGKVWVSTRSTQPMKRGDQAIFYGQLKEGFGVLAASMAQAELVSIRDPPTPDYALSIRDWFAGGIRTAIPDPQAALGAGYLVGQRSTLPPELDEQLKVVGLTHAVVASGYNLTILVGFSRNALLRHSKFMATLASVTMICSFMLITGFSPSMTRAGLVTGLSLAAWYFGRTIHPFVLLPFAAALTLIIDPTYLWGDLGWYLSFGSFIGLVLVAPLIKQYFWSKSAPDNTVRGIFIETTSAQIATLPIIMLSFGQVSAYSILANMLILPLVPLTMLLTFVAGISGLAAPVIAAWVGLPASGVLHYMISVIGMVAGWPGALHEFTLSMNGLWLGYGILAIALFYMWRRTGYNFKKP